MKPPCKGCPDRHELCHAECAKYLAYRAEKDRECAERLTNWNVRDIRARAVFRRKRDQDRKRGR